MAMPTFTIEKQNGFNILRDDLLPGGSKRRGLDILLSTVEENDIVYAGTIFGQGALALAHACADHGKHTHLFLAANDLQHTMIKQLKNTGAVIHTAAPLPVEQLHGNAQLWAKENSAKLFPLAFDAPEFQDAMAQALSSLDVSPYPEIWCVSVSGTFARSLGQAFANKTIRTVGVVSAGKTDFNAPEKYHQTAKRPPPYPACSYTDAKLWQFLELHATPGSLVWNIAG
jgi:hypothetical protein